VTWIESSGFAPVWFVSIFLIASYVIIWRLEALNRGGLQGTVLGTLVMPYCSGIGNIIFAYLLGSKGGSGADMLTNALVNNVTNMTLLLGLPAAIWGMHVLPKASGGGKNKKAAKKPGAQKEHQVNRLSLLLTLIAAIFFTGTVWALARKGGIDHGDGLVLVGLFLFWQAFHVYEVLKSNVRESKSFTWRTWRDLAVILVGAYAVYVSTDWIVRSISNSHTGFFSARYLGWLTGWLMVLPNATLAFYYAKRGKPEVVYTSQVGDGHVSIPLSIGIYALYRNIQVPAFFYAGAVILIVSAALHFFFVALFGRLPRWVGWLLVLAYIVFLAKGLG
jgi:cation:H+ antiporter